MTDDAVIMRRLMIDGDGTGDDRRLNMFLKGVSKWISSDMSEEDSQLTLDRLLTQLSQCELSMQKSRRACQMNVQQNSHYQKLYKYVSDKSDAVRAEIEQTKQELDAAKQVRRNRQEYDALAQLIQKHPDREKTQAELEALRQQLESLKNQEQSLDNKMHQRRVQFHAFLSCVHQLQELLDEEAEEAIAADAAQLQDVSNVTNDSQMSTSDM